MRIPVTIIALGTLLRVHAAHEQHVNVDITTPTTPRQVDIHVRVREDRAAEVRIESDPGEDAEQLSFAATDGSENTLCTTPCDFASRRGSLLWSLGSTLDPHHLQQTQVGAGRHRLRFVRPDHYAHGSGGVLLGFSIASGIGATLALVWFGLGVSSPFVRYVDPVGVSVSAWGVAVSVIGMIAGSKLLSIDTTPRLERIVDTIQVGVAPVAGGGAGTLSVRF